MLVYHSRLLEPFLKLVQILRQQTVVAKLAIAATTSTSIRTRGILLGIVFIETITLRRPMSVLGMGVSLHTEAEFLNESLDWIATQYIGLGCPSRVRHPPPPLFNVTILSSERHHGRSQYCKRAN